MARMLVIEDNSANLELMTYLIEAFGHTPITAADGASGLALAFAEQLDLILCDVQLPDLDGYVIAERLKRDPARSAIPLIAVTALAMVGDRDQLLAAGFDGYIAKPIAPESFVPQIEGFLPPAQRSLFAPVARMSAMHRPIDQQSHIGATILVVDDTLTNRELMCSILEPSGYNVITASGVREALALARKHAPDLIVSDLHMPEQNGFDLVRAVRSDAQLRRIKVVIHSATTQSQDDRRAALALGVTRFISRPLEPNTILAEIKASLQAPSE
jgi:two-component system cell cycle response regulator